MAYFTVYINDDGEISVEQFSKLELEQKLSDNWWGDTKYVGVLDNENSDPMYWGGNIILIIKGGIVVPKRVEVAIRYEV